MDSQEIEARRGYAGMPIPFGWFAVAMSHEIGPGEVRTLRYFGKEFVMWRGGDGQLRAVDPYCPHLGAHLGVGSDVVGNDLRCPFHHWSFNGEGGVESIPYTKLIPPKLKKGCTNSWQVAESNGVAYVWYHPKGAAPKWQIADLPPCPEGEWVLGETEEWLINIHMQDITENSQDHAHFNAVHSVPYAPSGEFKLDGWVRRNTVVAEMNTPRGPMTGKIDVTATGPGQSITEYIDVCHVVQSQQLSPIDDRNSHLRWQLYYPSGISEGKLRVTKARMRDLIKQLNQDYPIWNAKKFMPAPALVDGDGPIMAYRQQYARFYDYDAD